jgi:hypothetical protein
MTDAERKASHKIPEGVKRVKPGEYTFGPAHRIVQGDDKLWRAEGDGTESLKPMRSRGQVVEALRELGVVPADQPKPEQQPEQPQAEEAQQQPVLDPADASGASGANGATGERKRRPRTRKPAKEAAKASA